MTLGRVSSEADVKLAPLHLRAESIIQEGTGVGIYAALEGLICSTSAKKNVQRCGRAFMRLSSGFFSAKGVPQRDLYW